MAELNATSDSAWLQSAPGFADKSFTSPNAALSSFLYVSKSILPLRNETSASIEMNLARASATSFCLSVPSTYTAIFSLTRSAEYSSIHARVLPGSSVSNPQNVANVSNCATAVSTSVSLVTGSMTVAHCSDRVGSVVPLPPPVSDPSIG
ncbi:MIND kinetochore complex component Nnf1 [Histoplasma ohiense]